MFSGYRFILASRSPARKELMKKVAKKLGVRFSVLPSRYEEDMRAHGDPRTLARHLALGKAMEVARRVVSARGRRAAWRGRFLRGLAMRECVCGYIVIGADTFILCGGRKIGKPSSVSDARRIIRSMSGRMIEVWSGVAVVVVKSKIMARRARSVCTRLWVKRMSEREIDMLARQDGALEKSGAFGIEGIGGTMITRRDGDFDNVVGLPTTVLCYLLRSVLL